MQTETGPEAPKASTDAAPPLRRLRGRLTRADALAWESLPRELTGVRKFAFIAFVAAGGLWVGLAAEALGLDAAWLRLALILVAAALHWGLATVFLT